MIWPHLEFDSGRCKYVDLTYRATMNMLYKKLERRTFIYGLIDPRDNLVFYIGRTFNPAARHSMWDYLTRRPDKAINSKHVSERFQEILADEAVPIMRLLCRTKLELGEIREATMIRKYTKLNPKMVNRESRAAAMLGRMKSPRKTDAARRNGTTGGRPRTYPQCPLYKTHRFYKNICQCGLEKKVKIVLDNNPTMG